MIDKCDWNTGSKEGFRKFLESLKFRKTWKPNIVQLRSLQGAINMLHDLNEHSDVKALNSLFEDLKKLG